MNARRARDFKAAVMSKRAFAILWLSSPGCFYFEGKAAMREAAVRIQAGTAELIGKEGSSVLQSRYEEPFAYLSTFLTTS